MVRNGLARMAGPGFPIGQRKLRNIFEFVKIVSGLEINEDAGAWQCLVGEQKYKICYYLIDDYYISGIFLLAFYYCAF
jgi:hypothetical protein